MGIATYGMLGLKLILVSVISVLLYLFIAIPAVVLGGYWGLIIWAIVSIFVNGFVAHKLFGWE